MITLVQIIERADANGKRWISRDEGKVANALKNLNELHWPAVVNSSEFKCSKFSTPIVAKLLGYRKRICSTTADGKWRNNAGHASVLYELIRGE